MPNEIYEILRDVMTALLDEEKIPFSQPGRHRRIQLVDLMNYRELSRKNRHKALAELTQTAEEDGLYEEGTGFIETR